MVKLDIVSGFLGAGKTTLIQILLKHFMDKGQKTVYVVNEFGQAGIDGTLMQGKDFDVFELANGCICCTLKNEFVLVLKDIVEKIKPDRIIFEPSGIFVFSEFFSFMENDFFRGACEIEHCISVVDTVTFPKVFRTASYFIENQTRHSNLVILSKTQMEKAAVDETICDIRNISQDVPIVNIPWSDFTPEMLDEIMEVRPLPRATKAEFTLKRNAPSIKSAVAVKKSKHSNYETISFDVEPFETEEAMKEFVNKITEKTFGDVLRGKGFVQVGDDTYLVNVVDTESEITKHKYSADPRFTIIGTNLSLQDT